jgi:hypothetical protein
MYYSSDNKKKKFGIGFLLLKSLKPSITEFETISENM